MDSAGGTPEKGRCCSVVKEEQEEQRRGRLGRLERAGLGCCSSSFMQSVIGAAVTPIYR